LVALPRRESWGRRGSKAALSYVLKFFLGWSELTPKGRGSPLP